MKVHFIIVLKSPVRPRPNSWLEIICNRNALAAESLTPNVDELLVRLQLPVIVTSEYDPENGYSWNDAEIISKFDRTYRLILKETKKLPALLIEQLEDLPEVDFARLGEVGYTPIPKQQKSLAQSSILKKSHELIHLKEAHLYSKGSAEVKVAVLDTGIDMEHPEIAHALMPGRDFVNIINGASEFIGDYLDFDDLPDDSYVGHGTHVSGIICSAGKKMPVGIVPKCKIIPVRVLGAMKNGEEIVGAGLLDNINTGIKWAIDNGADIINMSLGIKHEGGGLPHKEIIQYALNKGVTVVAASGNDGQNDKYYPGALDGVIAVGAVNDEDEIAEFSSYGPHVSFVAPGTNIFSAYKLHGYAFSSGTSQASPFVAGSIALLKSYALDNGRKLSDRQIKYILKNTSDKPNKQIKNDKWGYGRINLIDAIKLTNYKFNI